ncbi:hypothetical protein QCA50_014816 [Cerrena zonata]|uniref:Retrotransposon gag domain-containing protein n=1 Tax=Cerrena zonata TaxID=2478898 RepID=A0AAW0FRN7_9APHY
MLDALSNKWLNQLPYIRERLLPRTHDYDDYERIPDYDPNDPILPAAEHPFIVAKVVLRSGGRHYQPSTWVLTEEPTAKISINSRIGFIAPNGKEVDAKGLVVGVKAVEKRWVEFVVDCGAQDRRTIFLQAPQDWASVSLAQCIRAAMGTIHTRFAPSTIPDLPIIVHIQHERVIWNDRSEGGRAFRRVVRPIFNPPHGSVFSNGLYRLDDRTLTFERVWRFADGSQESVPTNRFHDPSLTHNVSETVPPPRSRVSTSTGHRFLNKRLIEFNSQNGTWEYTSNSSGQPLENHYAVLDSEWADAGAQASSSGTSSTPTPPIPSSQPRPTTPLPRPQTPPRPKTPPPRSRTPVQNTPTQSIPPPNPQSQPSSSISTTQTNMSTNAKIELKTKFDGNANRVREITKHCDWKFALDPTTFDTNFKKSIYLLSCCEGGTAGPWAVEYSDTLDKASTATGAKVEDVFDWNKVKKAFIDYFSPVSQVSSAISAMRTLKQTGTVKEYVAAFRPLREQSNITEVAVLRDYFLDGLKDGLAYKIISIDPATIKTFEDLYGAAERLDEVYQSRPKKEQPSKTTYRPPVRYQSRGGRSFGRFKTIR